MAEILMMHGDRRKLAEKFSVSEKKRKRINVKT